MNATERARISDAYYSGTTTKREVCDAAALLREENENLRAENGKLRELLTFHLGCLTKGHINCDSCAFRGKDWCGRGRRIIEKAHELGIEVA